MFKFVLGILIFYKIAKNSLHILQLKGEPARAMSFLKYDINFCNKQCDCKVGNQQ